MFAWSVCCVFCIACIEPPCRSPSHRRPEKDHCERHNHTNFTRQISNVFLQNVQSLLHVRLLQAIFDALRASVTNMDRNGIGFTDTCMTSPKSLRISLLVHSGSNRVSTNRMTAGVVSGRSLVAGHCRSPGKAAGGSTMTSTSRNRAVSDDISSENCKRPPSR